MSFQNQHPVSRETEPLRKRTACGSECLRQLTVPNDRSMPSIVSFVEWVLIELTYADVGAEYRSTNVWGAKRTQYSAADSIGETFTKRHYDERLGWQKETITREELRGELINRLTRSEPLATNRSHSVPIEKPDTFCVKALWKLR